MFFLAAGRQGALAQLPDAPRALLLDVVVNGARIGLLGEFVDRARKLYAARKELDSLGFRLTPARNGVTPDTQMLLTDLPGVSYRLDETTQTVYVTAPGEALKPNELGAPDDGASSLPVQSGTGVVANYDLAVTYADHRSLAEMLVDGRMFTPWGVAESSLTATNAQSLQAAPVVRLDSSFTMSDQGSLTQYRLGDVISGGLSWSRPVRLGGFQISTDFGIRPDLVTFPVPSITGEVAVPSSIDVLVNGIQELSQQVPAGPFEIRQLPVVTGVGDVSVVMRNAAGQQTTQTLQLYTSRQLVAPGLSDMSAEFGLVRLNYGTESDDYRAPAGSVSYRRGLTKWLTFEGHAEGSGGGGSYQGLKIAAGGMAGGGAVLGLGRFGVVSADIAASRSGRRSGGLASIGYERIAPHVSFSASLQSTSGKFGDVASAYGDPVPSLQARAVLGFSWQGFGSLGIAYTDQRRPASLAQASQASLDDVTEAQRDNFGFVPLVLASRASLLSVSYSRPMFGDRAMVSATAFHDFAESSSSGLTFAINFQLGRRSSVTAETDASPSGADGVIQATQTASEIGETGFQLREEAGAQSRQLAIGTYRAPWGLVDAGIDRTDGDTALRADIQGALTYAAGGFFASLPIYDSFAVVDTDGVAGIHVLQENRPVGVTGASGQMLVTDLRAFDANRIGVDPADIPMDAEPGPTSRLVRPRDRSGVVVRFPMRSNHGAVVALRDASGAPVEVGSSATLAGARADQKLAVGYDGEVFVTGLKPHNRLMVQQPNGTACVASFAYAAEAGRIPHIGPVVCSAPPP
jgi:outer membrane usher protein